VLTLFNAASTTDYKICSICLNLECWMVLRSQEKKRLRQKIYMVMTSKIERLFSNHYFQKRSLLTEEFLRLKMYLEKLTVMVILANSLATKSSPKLGLHSEMEMKILLRRHLCRIHRIALDKRTIWLSSTWAN